MTVISNVQAMVISFLRQLADCAEGIKSTVAIQLVDRRKPRNKNGCDTPSLKWPILSRRQEISDADPRFPKSNSERQFHAGSW
jgi:hypothetical protein